ncbi:MAG: hypothetical protein BKP49_08025 [Treponema sp. CETP13]|nr:MAG: hypothetical protein BKP49_08025 [Treponema sp. CETP13]
MTEDEKLENEFDKLLTQNTRLQNTAYYRIITWNHENEGRIRKRAYELYEDRVRNNEEGNALADWYEAKSILLLLEFIK